MELWIRSQDRQRLIKANGLLISNIGEVYLENEEMILLGKYTPYERALEVLDEIQNILKPKLFLNSGKITGSFDNTIYREPDKVEIQELSAVVYEMPKD